MALFGNETGVGWYSSDSGNTRRSLAEFGGIFRNSGVIYPTSGDPIWVRMSSDFALNACNRCI